MTLTELIDKQKKESSLGVPVHPDAVGTKSDPNRKKVPNEYVVINKPGDPLHNRLGLIVRREADHVLVEVESGIYNFTSELKYLISETTPYVRP